MQNVVVADTKTHAQAVIGWTKLDDSWVPMQFGAFLDQDFNQAKLVRPAKGVTAEHYVWIQQTLMPRIKGEISLAPPEWIDSEEGPAETHEIGMNAVSA